MSAAHVPHCIWDTPVDHRTTCIRTRRYMTIRRTTRTSYWMWSDRRRAHYCLWAIRCNRCMRISNPVGVNKSILQKYLLEIRSEESFSRLWPCTYIFEFVAHASCTKQLRQQFARFSSHIYFHVNAIFCLFNLIYSIFLTNLKPLQPGSTIWPVPAIMRTKKLYVVAYNRTMSNVMAVIRAVQKVLAAARVAHSGPPPRAVRKRAPLVV